MAADMAFSCVFGERGLKSQVMILMRLVLVLGWRKQVLPMWWNMISPSRVVFGRNPSWARCSEMVWRYSIQMPPRVVSLVRLVWKRWMVWKRVSTSWGKI